MKDKKPLHEIGMDTRNGDQLLAAVNEKWSPFPMREQTERLELAIRHVKASPCSAPPKQELWEAIAALSARCTALAAENMSLQSAFAFERHKSEVAEARCTALEQERDRYKHVMELACDESREAQGELATCHRELERLRQEREQLELEVRKMLWLGHGHTRLYGDDGEMQCGLCAPLWDYRRAPLAELQQHVLLLRLKQSNEPSAESRCQHLEQAVKDLKVIEVVCPVCDGAGQFRVHDGTEEGHGEPCRCCDGQETISATPTPAALASLLPSQDETPVP